MLSCDQVGDRILAVNGQDVRQASQEYAINLIKNSGESIKLEIQSFDLNVSISVKTFGIQAWAKSIHLMQDIAAKKSNMDEQIEKLPSDGEKISQCKHTITFKNQSLVHSEGNGSQTKTPSIAIADGTTDSSNEEDSEEEESLGKVVTKMGKEIDRKSAGNIKRSKEEVKADLEPENEYGYTDSKLHRWSILIP